MTQPPPIVGRVSVLSPGPRESTWWRGKRGFRVGFFPHHCVAVIGDKVPRHMTQPPPVVGRVSVLSPGPRESTWWRGKRGFRVGFFPHHCVAVIGDKVPRHMTQPPPIVGRVSVLSPGPRESTWWRGKRGFRVGFFPHHCVAVIGDKVPRHMTQPPPIVGRVSVLSPGPQESTWWRGKREFRVGLFPHHCVAVIGDKVPRHMTQPPPVVGSVAVAPIKPVLRKHGKLISLFRSFILSRPSRRRLKQQGILRERVFGCDLGEHLLNFEHDVPLVLVECAKAIEARGAVDGIYRLSGGSGLTQRLRAAFDSGEAPDLPQDPHATASLLKMYFRELPNPLCTYQLYESFVSAVQTEESKRLKAVRDVVVKLPPPHYRTLAYLMRHLRRVSLLGDVTGMTARNMAIVWAPNLLRSPRPQHALQHVSVQVSLVMYHART
ncbi:GTPase-activating protein CdGAPr-like [Cydia fagiglandana]|uniref:GTPase-activating protein CdGAPr-like n=1 Tax=Cydia fagiglandana TaxID=1458189 RepID=UPI002FEE0A85